MKSKIKYTNEPMGKLKVVNDFVPPPDQLVLKEVAESIQSFRGKLKWHGNLDELRKNKR
jgi:hypothetical protein